MKRALFLLALLTASHLALAQEQACATLDACVAQLVQIAGEQQEPYNGISQDVNDLASRIAEFPGATEMLVPLLQDPDLGVATYAGLALSRVSSIPVEYLDAIITGLNRELGWLVVALARIDSDDAARESVDRYLASSSSPYNQEAAAVRLSGARAIPYIVDRAACSQECSRNTHWLLRSVLQDMQSERALAVEGLMELVADPEAPLATRRGVLGMIGGLREDGRVLEERLVTLMAVAPELKPSIEEVLIEMGSQRSGKILAHRLEADPDVRVLRDTAFAGHAAMEAGPVIARILENDPALRAPAAMALGFIGYEAGIPALVEALHDPADLRVVWAAANALGRLRATTAIDALTATSREHWYPPVRDAAQQALRAIHESQPNVSAQSEREFISVFFAFENLGLSMETCETPAERARREPRGTKLYASTSSARLKELAYQTQIVSYGASDEEEQRAAGEQIIRVHEGNLREYRRLVEQVPDVALRVEDGWLVGADRGEWVGELVFRPDDGLPQFILDANVEDIYRLGDRIVVTTGLAHLSLNNGVVFCLVRDASNLWQAETWRILPGAPQASYLVKPDGLLIQTWEAGTVVLDPQGGLRMARCKQVR